MKGHEIADLLYTDNETLGMAYAAAKAVEMQALRIAEHNGGTTDNGHVQYLVIFHLLCNYARNNVPKQLTKDMFEDLIDLVYLCELDTATTTKQ